MKYPYEIVLRSKKLDTRLPDLPRDGGVEPGGSTYSRDILNEKFPTDKAAMKFAETEAEKRNMMLLRVTKTLFNNPEGWRG